MKILVVDDHIILRKGLINMLAKVYRNYKFIEASNGAEAISMLKKHDDTILILSDLTMPKMNGIEMLKQLKLLKIITPVIMLTMHSEKQYALRALKAGAFGFLNKNVAPEELEVAIEKVLSGKKYITSSLADILSDNISKSNNNNVLDLLSDREMQVFELISKGKTVSEIANDISLSVSTVSTYRVRVLSKLNLKNNAELIIYAKDNSL